MTRHCVPLYSLVMHRKADPVQIELGSNSRLWMLMGTYRRFSPASPRFSNNSAQDSFEILLAACS